MNYMEQVAHMLGVELFEDFKVVDYDDYIFKITDDGLRCKGPDGWHREVFTFDDILCGRTEIIKKSILTKQEKEYLSYVIKPFRKEVRSIMKVKYCKEAYIQITFHDYCDMSFPYFEDGTMYKGMKADKEYTLEDLGL